MTDQDARHFLERAERAATAGDLASADELLRNAARIQEQELGPYHPDLANTLNNLAIVAETTGSSSEAEAFYRRAAAITAAALPPDHPMRMASRENLESFCRARGLPIDAPAVATPAEDPEPEPRVVATRPTVADNKPVRPDDTGITAKATQSPLAVARPSTPRTSDAIAPDSNRSKGSNRLPWVATGTLVLVAVVLLSLRPWSSRDTSSGVPPSAPATAPPAEAAPPTPAAASTAPIEPPAPPAPATPRDPPKVATKQPPAAAGIAVATAQVCRTFSISGSNWRCDPVGETAAPGPMVFYTRVKSPRAAAIVHRWYRGGTLRQSRTLAIQANATDGFRTYSRLTVDKGNWRVEVRTADGALLHEQRIAIQ